jgi:predicted regulator of Ras-like GTPase activity (Roadblock/LC7/MglB family)
MDTILQSLHELEGVNGSIVADGGGRILGYRAHVVYDADLLQQVSKQIVSAVDSIKLIQEDWDAITAQFSEGKLLIRNLTSGSQHKNRTATLAVIADARLNISFAGVAIRVAVAKLKAMLDGSMPEPLPLGALSSQSSVSQPHPTQVHAAVAPTASSLSGAGAGASGYARPTTSEVATSGLSWSGLSGSSSVSGSGVSVADPASSAFLTLCTKALARSVGPMAKVFVKEAARKVSPERPFSRDSAQELITELLKHFEDPAEAAQFRNLVQKSL